MSGSREEEAHLSTWQFQHSVNVLCQLRCVKSDDCWEFTPDRAAQLTLLVSVSRQRHETYLFSTEKKTGIHNYQTVRPLEFRVWCHVPGARMCLIALNWCDKTLLCWMWLVSHVVIAIIRVKWAILFFFLQLKIRSISTSLFDKINKALNFVSSNWPNILELKFNSSAHIGVSFLWQARECYGEMN